MFARLGVLDDSGQGLAEYALILGFIALLCVAAVLFLGGKIAALWSSIGNAEQQAV